MLRGIASTAMSTFFRVRPSVVSRRGCPRHGTSPNELKALKRMVSAYGIELVAACQ